MEEDKKEIKMTKRKEKEGNRREEGGRRKVGNCGGIMIKRFKSRREGCKG